MNASKSDLVAATMTQLPDAKASAARAQSDAQSDAEVAALVARGEVAKAQEAIDKLAADTPATTREQKQYELVAAKIKANKAYRKAGLPEPYIDVSF